MMQDKLYKNGHKGIYYRARRFFLFSILAATIIAGVSISTYIAVTQNVKAEETISEVIDEDTSIEHNGDADSLL